MFLKNRIYNFLKYTTQIALPALGTFYYAIANNWGLPKPAEVVATDTAVITLLGILLGLSTRSYNNSTASHDGYLGTQGVDPDTGHPDLKLIFTKLPNELMDKKTVRLKVGSPPDPTEELDHG
jgi:hypothetical protein